MKIVIDIPRKTYEHIRADGGHGYFNIYDEDNRIVTKAVFNGKKLPEHHGRLIDADKLPYEDIESIDGNTYMCVNAYDIEHAPTIVEGSDSKCQE